MISKLIEWTLPLRRRATLAQLKRRKASVRIAPGRCGFFGNLFITANGIRLCEAAGVHPIPYWDERCLYFDSARGSNAWDYFYKPIEHSNRADTLSIQSNFELAPDAGVIYPLYPKRSIRESYFDCFQKFVRLRDDILEPLNQLKSELFGQDYCIGVHVRLTDAATAVEGRVTSGLDLYFQSIDKQLEKCPQARLFVATDSSDALTKLRQRYGERVLFVDCIRSDGTQSIHGHYDAGVPGSPYRKGLDVIQDAFLLANTQHLIRVHSRVTAYSLCINPTLTFDNILGKADDDRANWLSLSN